MPSIYRLSLFLHSPENGSSVRNPPTKLSGHAFSEPLGIKDVDFSEAFPANYSADVFSHQRRWALNTALNPRQISRVHAFANCGKSRRQLSQAPAFCLSCFLERCHCRFHFGFCFPLFCALRRCFASIKFAQDADYILRCALCLLASMEAR